MTAMMLPSVLPWITALSRLPGMADSSRPVGMATGEFLLGYFLIWTLYSVGAAQVQWLLHDWALVSSNGVLVTPTLAGGLLVLAGLFQWTSLKQRRLDQCRSPVSFFLTSWKAGRWSLLRIGFIHGLFCVGCCWALMALAFVVGVMNLVWMALLTLFVFIDHTILRGQWAGRSIGVGMVAWGAWIIREAL